MGRPYFIYSISLAAAGAFTPNVALASEIGSGGSIEEARGFNIHETITDLALECVERSEGRPEDCSDLHSEIAARAEQNRPEETLTLAYATRWPDDPLRILDQTITQIRFGLPLLEGCKTALSNGDAINRTGLLCASHFGKLQFFHAMMAPDAPESFPEQRNLVLSWADFAFRASTDEGFANQDYCETVDSLSDEHLKDALAFDDTSSPQSFCKERKHPVFRWIKYPPWQVASLFAFSCEEPINMSTCGVEPDIVARQAAEGAILHLIQDSYSQSHASRRTSGDVLAAKGPFVPLVVCAPVRHFYVYQDQVGESDTHKPADKLPEIDPSCLAPNRAVDDVITASANAIYFLRKSDADGFATYLSSRVFPSV